MTIVHRLLIWCVLCALWFPTARVLADEPICLESLLDEMIDRDNLARFPSPGYVCRQASSYDRETKSPDQPGWFANWDRSQFVRIEENAGRRECVLMDEEGPGAVVRFWSTWHGPRGKPFSNGTLRFYFDGKPEPGIEGPIADLISGGALVDAPLSESVSPQTEIARRGHNLYLPIPYASHCKITYETDQPIDVGGKQGEALYYQINYRTYRSATRVTTFSTEQLESLESKIEKIGEQLVQPSGNPPLNSARQIKNDRLKPNDTTTFSLKGPAAVRQWYVRLNAEDLAQALRSTVLEITFDDEPCVWCPLGDFLGIGYRVQPHRTWYTEVTEDGVMGAFWVMPFERSCELTIRNLGTQPIEIERGIDTSPWTWDERSMHFHAAWRQYTKIDTGPNKDMTGRGAFDVNYIEVTGQGQYVGDTLTLFNGTSAWWGEGDEKIYLDGEKFPSHIGTGTEDYYGYAWCRPEFFASPFHAQPTGSGNLSGGFSVNSRYRGLDAMPFNRSIRFDMEMWHWRGTKMNFAPTTFWYARPGATCNVRPDPETAILKVALKRSDIVEIYRVPNALEGETFKILETSGGTTEIQDLPKFHWSGDRQLWWRDAKPGDRLVLQFNVPKAGTYRVLANLTKAVDYAIVQITLAGQKATEPFDRYHTEVLHDPLDLGQFSLKAGPNRLEVEIKGANEKAVKRHMFGLDYLKLEKIE